MQKLSYDEWLEHFASGCNRCEGSRSINIDGIYVRCPCQDTARRKHRLENVEILPPELKYKDWKDFNGTIKKGDIVTGRLTFKSAIEARSKAFRYCFGQEYSDEVLADRFSHVCVHEHLKDGQNVIIAGDERSGRTFLSILILKEISVASALLRRDIDYRWVPSHKIISSARWDTGTSINQQNLDAWSGLDFLFIDGVEIQKGGHNTPPDHIAMNGLFYERRAYSRPNIVVCSLDFWKRIKLSAGQQFTVHNYGAEFFNMITSSDNVVIELHKE